MQVKMHSFFIRPVLPLNEILYALFPHDNKFEDESNFKVTLLSCTI